MDTDILKAIPDCKNIKGKPCHWWYEVCGKCRKPAGIDCPEGVRLPQQEFVDSDYSILDFVF